MNHYFFALMPEVQFGKKVEELRMELIGTKLVDALPPHLTLKRRFSLGHNFSEQNLREVFDNFPLSKILTDNNKIERLGEASAIRIENFELKECHQKLYGLLKNNVINKNPEYEDDHFIAHLTLFRDPKNNLSAGLNGPNINQIVFDAICLYEIDPTPSRRFARKIACRYLN